MSSKYDWARQVSYIALDVSTGDEALCIVEEFGEAVDGYKIGLELYHADGPRVMESLLSRNKRVFLDVKLHDIPNTVSSALKVICQNPIEMVNVHAFGGLQMLEAARKAVNEAPYHPLLIAVTVLTSMEEEDLQQIGVPGTVEFQIQRLLNLALQTEMDGIVASAKELEVIRKMVPTHFETVIPGTRPKGVAAGDQKRIMTPGEAISLGASRLVLGRAVLAQTDRCLALQRIWDEMLLAQSQVHDIERGVES